MDKPNESPAIWGYLYNGDRPFQDHSIVLFELYERTDAPDDMADEAAMALTQVVLYSIDGRGNIRGHVRCFAQQNITPDTSAELCGEIIDRHAARLRENFENLPQKLHTDAQTAIGDISVARLSTIAQNPECAEHVSCPDYLRWLLSLSMVERGKEIKAIAKQCNQEDTARVLKKRHEKDRPR